MKLSELEIQDYKKGFAGNAKKYECCIEIVKNKP